MTDAPAIRAVPAPADRDAMVREVHRAWFQFGTYTGGEAVADKILCWLTYERQLSESTIALKLRAERAMGMTLEEAAQAAEEPW